jgi:hypothetical protein
MLAMATAATLWTGPVYAQNMNQGQKTPLQLQYERDRAEREMIEKDYDDAMKRTRRGPVAPTGAVDPWAVVRPVEGDKAKR